MTSHTIIIGDARDMREVPDSSVHLVVTSPPYWQLKDYGSPKQIGFDDTYEAYINNLNLVWHECRRVLHPGCRLCINIGDQFARSVYYGRYKIIPIRTEIIKFCESDGFDYMGAVIWRKVTTCNTTGGAVVMGSFPYPRNGILKLDYEFILIFKKYGEAPKASKAVKEASKMTTDEWNEYFSGHWTFPGEKQKKHLAMFPEELPRRLIRMFSFVGDTVLDPFLGSGTTMLASRNLGRDSIGYEINPDFEKVIKEKVNAVPRPSGPGFDASSQRCRHIVTAPDREDRSLLDCHVDSLRLSSRNDDRARPKDMSGPGSDPDLSAQSQINRRGVRLHPHPDSTDIPAGKPRVPRPSGPGSDPNPTTESRIDRRGVRLHAHPDIEFINRDDGDVDYGAAIRRLPYIFHDPIAIDKKMDPRKNHFGSRIAMKSFVTKKRRSKL